MCGDGHKWWGDHWSPQGMGSPWYPILGFQFRVRPRATVLLHPLMVFHWAKTTGPLAGKSCSLLAWVTFILEAENTVTHTDVHTPPSTSPPTRPTHLWSQEREGVGVSISLCEKEKKKTALKPGMLRKNDHFYRSLVHRGGFTHPVMVLVPDREAAWKKVGVSAENWSEQKRVLAGCRLALKWNGWLADPWLLLG